MRKILSIGASLAMMFSASAALAHELWLDTYSYQIAPSDNIVSDIKVGQDFSGGVQSYLPNNFARFDTALGEKLAPIEGRLGDRPAANIPPLGDGLNVLLYQSMPLDVFYSEWDKFVSFAEHKDFTWALERHVARGLPKDERFREVYTRYAKSLVAVGGGKGEDHAYGLETEFVALENPYIDDMSDGFDVRVLYKNEARENAQIEVFERSPIEGADVAVFTIKTDQNGAATIPVKPGHTYQIDAVVLREPDPVIFEDAAWETLWANMTFAIPE